MAVHRELSRAGAALPGAQRALGVCPCRHVRNGAVIARCSQPEISWWGWRNADDEYLVTSIAKACALNPGAKASGAAPQAGSSEGSEPCDADFGEMAPAGPPEWGRGRGAARAVPGQGFTPVSRGRTRASLTVLCGWLSGLTVALGGGRCQELSPCVSLQTRP